MPEYVFQKKSIDQNLVSQARLNLTLDGLEIAVEPS